MGCVLKAKITSENYKYLIGIDGGGSKCRARLTTSSGELLALGTSGSANYLLGARHSLSSLLQSIDDALSKVGLTQDIFKDTVVGVGLAGVIMPDRNKAFLASDLPFKKMFVTSDQHVACIGAHDGGEGAVIIVGTGSCGVSQVKGQVLEYGGHGFPIGDKGAGAWMGLRALQHSLREENNLGRVTVLTKMLYEFFDVTDSFGVIEKMSGALPADYARIAPMIFIAAQENDDVALEIIQDGAAYISRMARSILKSSPPRLSILGGLGPRLIDWLDKEVASHVRSPLKTPEEGAIMFALDSLKS